MFGETWHSVLHGMQYLSFCDQLISLSVMTSRSTYVVANGGIFFFFKYWIIFQRTYVPCFLSFFICQWAFGLFPYLGCCEQCCCESGVVDISLRLWFQFLLDIYSGVRLLNHMEVLFLIFLRKFHSVFYISLPVYISANVSANWCKLM